MKRTLIIGIIGGLSLYLIDTAYAWLAYYKLPDILFKILLCLIPMCAVGLAIFTMLFKVPSFAQTLLRFLTFVVSFIFVVLFFAYTGARLYIEETLFAPSSVAENFSGLLSLALLFAVVVSSVIAIAVFGIIRLTRARGDS